MRLPDSSILAKVNAITAFAALVVYTVGFGTQNWLNKDFDFPLHVGGVDSLAIRANVGLLKACKIEMYANGKSTTSCSPDGAADWQIISAVLAIGGLVLGLVGVLLSVLGVVSQRLAGNFKVKCAIVFCHLLVCGFLAGPLIMFPVNKTIIVSPSVSDYHVDFDLGYSYLVASASECLFAYVLLLNVIDIIWSSYNDNSKGKHRALSKYINSLN